MKNGESITVTIPITNTGSREGAEVVQGYVKDVKSRLPRPEKELRAFDKVFLEAGETKVATLVIDRYSVGYWDTDLGDTETGGWVAEKGTFEALIGASSADIREKIAFEVEESFTWIF